MDSFRICKQSAVKLASHRVALAALAAKSKLRPAAEIIIARRMGDSNAEDDLGAVNRRKSCRFTLADLVGVVNFFQG